MVWRQSVKGEFKDTSKELEDGVIKGLEMGLKYVQGEGTEEVVDLGGCEAVVEDLEKAYDGASFVGVGGGGGTGN